jgi:hypothetical protein
MAAVAGARGLSALLAWPTDHLTEAAARPRRRYVLTLVRTC